MLQQPSSVTIHTLPSDSAGKGVPVVRPKATARLMSGRGLDELAKVGVADCGIPLDLLRPSRS